MSKLGLRRLTRCKPHWMRNRDHSFSVKHARNSMGITTSMILSNTDSTHKVFWFIYIYIYIYIYISYPFPLIAWRFFSLDRSTVDTKHIIRLVKFFEATAAKACHSITPWSVNRIPSSCVTWSFQWYTLFGNANTWLAGKSLETNKFKGFSLEENCWFSRQPYFITKV